MSPQIKALTSLEKLCLISLKTRHTSAELNEFSSLLSGLSDKEQLVHIAVKRGIAPLLYNALNQSSTLQTLSTDLQIELAASTNKVMIRTIRFVGYYEQIATAFHKAEIDFIPLKGIYLIDWVYKSYEYRVMSDMDLLVQPADAERSLQVLQELGYCSNSDFFFENKVEIIHYPPLVKEGVCVELHVKLHRKAERYSLPVEVLFANATMGKVHNQPCHVMDKYDALIFTCLHLDKHFKDGHVQFTSFADIVNILTTNEINWLTLASKCKQYHCEKEVFTYLLLMDSFFSFQPDAFISANYNRYNKPATTSLFLKYLNGYRGFSSGMPMHLSSISNFTTLADKLKYTITILFPPREFMLSKFKIKNNKAVWFYYVYRWWLGMKGLFKTMVND